MTRPTGGAVSELRLSAARSRDRGLRSEKNNGHGAVQRQNFIWDHDLLDSVVHVVRKLMDFQKMIADHSMNLSFFAAVCSADVPPSNKKNDRSLNPTASHLGAS